MEAIWKPVSANEASRWYADVLFLNCKNNNARERVCERFSNMYNDNPSDFPIEARELEYRERMIRCYPIHPEVFDRLYEDWATLERFQRTRGVLRLMAAVIHELWMRNDQSPMIMPGSFPLDVPSVRDELTRYLDDPWNGVVDSEIDGKRSLPYRNDAENQRYGKTARIPSRGASHHAGQRSRRQRTVGTRHRKTACQPWRRAAGGKHRHLQRRIGETPVQIVISVFRREWEQILVRHQTDTAQDSRGQGPTDQRRPRSTKWNAV